MSEDNEAWRRRLAEELFGNAQRMPSRSVTTDGTDKLGIPQAPPDARGRSEPDPIRVDTVKTDNSPPPDPAARVSAAQTQQPRTSGGASYWRLYAAGAALTTAGVVGGLLLGRAYFAAVPPSAEPAKIPRSPTVATTNALAITSVTQALCSSPQTLEGLKAIVFGQARRLGGPNPAWLEALASTTTLRVEGAYLKALDTSNTVAVCAGRMVLQLAGNETKAISETQLPAVAVGYSVLPAIDARGRVYTLDGAAPLVRNLVELEPEPVLEPLSSSGSAVSAIGGRDTRTSSVNSAVRMPATRSAVQGATATRVRHHGTGHQPKPVKTKLLVKKLHKIAATPTVISTHSASRADRMITTSASLRALDNDVALLSTPSDHDDARLSRSIERMQAAFVARRKRCGTSECLIRTYRQHIDSLARLRRGRPILQAPTSARILESDDIGPYSTGTRSSVQ